MYSLLYIPLPCPCQPFGAPYVCFAWSALGATAIHSARYVVAQAT